jgi:tetratricopeptide (TPR) repeat protein/tRNA A-37 threonylcarbamoyl transferase component Bud32
MTEFEAKTEAEPDSSHPSAECLKLFALGHLPEVDLIQCAAHLEICPGCRQFAATVPGDALVTLLQDAAHPDTASSESAAPLRLQRGYELIEEIGRGGMAVVLKARQRDLGRIVALKQIKPEMMTAEGLLRFRVEAGVMARVQHPNIVQIYDVGEQDGRPYLAFEFVSGGSLDRQLAGNPLPVRVACQLVATLARAVHVAHEQSIIHRDLKPSNVLLAFDRDLSADPSDERFWEAVVPKIGDFGLAKHLDQPQGRTYTGEILGTPGYMSPEQARGGGDKIATATDIFSLGVILYETLTGRRPFVGTSIVQTLELICTADPVPPSHWQPRLATDLDVVCLKCLEKDPRRRYATAADLADDLERWLAGEPILARPVASWERVWKWVKRNPAKSVVIAGCVLVLCSLTCGVLIHNRRLQAAVTRANINEAVALANFRRGHDVIQKMIEDVADVSVNTESWRRLRENLYSRAREYHESALEGADESNPDVRLAKTMALIYRGSMQVILGEYREAIRHLEPAQKQLESLLQQSPDNAEVRSNLARCYRNLGWAYTSVSDFRAAEKYYGQSLEHLTRLVAAKPDDLDFRRRLAGLNGDIGKVYFVTDRRSLAEQACRRSLELWRTTAEDESFSDSDRDRCGRTGLDVAIICLIDGRVDESESLLKQNEVILAPAPGRSSSLSAKKLLAETFWLEGELAISRHQTDLALTQTEKAIEILNDVLSQEPREEASREALGRYSSGKEKLLDELGAGRKTPPDRPAAINVSEQEGIAANLLVEVREHRLENRWETAETELKEIESHLLSMPKEARSSEAWHILADAYFEWAELAIGLDRLEDAFKRYDQSIETLDDLLTRKPDDADIHAALSWRHRLKAWHLSRAGRTDSAFASWDLAIRHATGDVRSFTQAERALERALLGDHAGAALEADAVAIQPDLKSETAVHLARVYSCCINASQRDTKLSIADRERQFAAYAEAAIRCLNRIESTYFAAPEKRAELSSDSQLESLRKTEQFQRWLHEL